MDWPERSWRFWRPIVAPGGFLRRKKVQAELADYLLLLDNVPLAYHLATGGLVSDPHTHVNAVMDATENYVAKCVDEGILEALVDVLDILEGAKSDGEAVSSLKLHIDEIHAKLAGA